MADKYMQLVLTPAVQRMQEKYFGRYQAVADAPERNAMTPRETNFLKTRDSFYMSTVSETGWPYLQHRGGPSGFLKVLGPNSLGFADYRGNRQLLSTGNIEGNDRVALFFMDYRARERLKMLGHAKVLRPEEEPELAQQLNDPEMEKRVERLFLIEIISYDWNCPQYITQRFTAAEVREHIKALKERIAELEVEVVELKKR